jgi:hypothetical protein
MFMFDVSQQRLLAASRRGLGQLGKLVSQDSGITYDFMFRSAALAGVPAYDYRASEQFPARVILASLRKSKCATGHMVPNTPYQWGQVIQAGVALKAVDQRFTKAVVNASLLFMYEYRNDVASPFKELLQSVFERFNEFTVDTADTNTHIPLLFEDWSCTIFALVLSAHSFADPIKCTDESLYTTRTDPMRLKDIIDGYIRNNAASTILDTQFKSAPLTRIVTVDNSDQKQSVQELTLRAWLKQKQSASDSKKWPRDLESAGRDGRLFIKAQSNTPGLDGMIVLRRADSEDESGKAMRWFIITLQSKRRQNRSVGVDEIYRSRDLAVGQIKSLFCNLDDKSCSIPQKKEVNQSDCKHFAHAHPLSLAHACNVSTFDPDTDHAHIILSAGQCNLSASLPSNTFVIDADKLSEFAGPMFMLPWFGGSRE